MAETRINLRHLLENLRDSYPFSIEEAIITELIAIAIVLSGHLRDDRSPQEFVSEFLALWGQGGSRPLLPLTDQPAASAKIQ